MVKSKFEGQKNPEPDDPDKLPESESIDMKKLDTATATARVAKRISEELGLDDMSDGDAYLVLDKEYRKVRAEYFSPDTEEPIQVGSRFGALLFIMEKRGIDYEDIDRQEEEKGSRAGKPL